MQKNKNGFYNANSNSDRSKEQSQSEKTKPLFDNSTLTVVNFADRAKDVIEHYKNKMNSNRFITTTQLRALFSLLTEVRENIRMQNSTNLNEEMQGRIQYIKMRFAYAAGKGEQRGEKDVKYFVEISGMIECLDTVKDSVKQFELVCKYMEALVAYHKYYIGG